MENYNAETKKIKSRHYIFFGIFAGLIIAMVITGCAYQEEHSFSTSKWETNPRERTQIVDDLLEDYELIGMQESEILDLLGDHDNDYGYFNEKDRFVYCLGPERGLISIDNEWLILDFADRVVVDYYITTD